MCTYRQIGTFDEVVEEDLGLGVDFEEQFCWPDLGPHSGFEIF